MNEGGHPRTARTSFGLSGVWKIDYLKDSTSPLRVLTQDWTLSAIVTLQTGTPLTIGAGQDRNLDGLTNDRADLDRQTPSSIPAARARKRSKAGSTSAHSPTLRLARTAVPGGASSTARAIGTSTWASSGMSACRGASMLQFRLEATNVFNIVNLNGPGTNLAAPALFGKIRSARNMRQIQLGARVSF